MNIYTINKSSVLSDTQVKSWIPAFNRYVGHVRSLWPRPTNVVWSDIKDEPELAWKLVFADTSDEAGALGYHDFTPNGRPISYVFAQDDIKYGYDPTITATHELSEMIADPWISQVFQITDKTFFAQEVADACEADELGYEIKVDNNPAIMVSDFVYPKWFIPGSGGKYDHQGHIDQPLKLLPGGYMSVYVVGKGWTQIFADKRSGELKEEQDPKNKGRFSRLVRYGRDRGVPPEAEPIVKLLEKDE